MTVPCGQCIGCRIDRSRHWALRCVHESKFHLRNSFLTLTYSDDLLPAGLSLEKKHLQDFFKRLRNYGFEFRYFAVGEYSDSNRPHYHVLLFGEDFSADRKKHSSTPRGDIQYISATLQKIWGFGHCMIGSFNYATAAYTARYVMKKQFGTKNLDHENYSRVDLVTGQIYQVLPEFSLMSRKPGIGSQWYEKYKSDAFPSDFLIHEGKKHPVPRYYYEKLKKEEPKKFEKISTKRAKARLENAHNSTPDRLYTREECKKSQISQLKRNL